MAKSTIKKLFNLIGDNNVIFDVLQKTLESKNFVVSESEKPKKMEMTRGKHSLLAKSLKDVKTTLTATLEQISDNVKIELEYAFHVPSLYVNKSDKGIDEEFEDIKREMLQIFPFGTVDSEQIIPSRQETESEQVLLQNTVETQPETIQVTQQSQKQFAQLSKSMKEKDAFMMYIIDDMKFNLLDLERFITNLSEEKSIAVNRVYFEQLLAMKLKFQTLIRIMGNLFDVQKIEMNELNLTKNHNRLSQLIKNVTQQLDADAKKRDVSITTDIVEEFNCYCDKKRIEQVLTNLIINAIDFCSQGNGQINIILQRDGNNAKITVQDNGIGIVRESLEKIFERIYQLNLSIIREHGEGGIGLPVAKGIIDAHGGKMWAESEGTDRGASIHFTLPLSDIQSETLRRVE